MDHEEDLVLKSKFKLKKIVAQLGAIKGRHTELVTVYVPEGANLHDIVATLRSEQSTAENIKSKPVRKNVVSALEKIMRHLQLYKKTPETGMAIFCGNVSEREGAADIDLWAIEPPEPIKTKLYWCDQTFVMEPLLEQVEEKEIYGIVCLDKNDADIAILKGKKIEPIAHFESIVPGKTRAGGQSSARFSRVREGMLNDWLKRVGEACNKIFEEHKEIKGVIVSGSGPIKEMFLKEDYLHGQVKQKVIGIVDTSYTGDQGLQETLVRGEDLLKEADITKEKKLLQNFFTELQKPHGLGIYGIENVLKIMRQGAVDMVIIYENLDMKLVELECQCGQSNMFIDDFHKNKQRCPQCGLLKRVLGEKDIIEFFEEEVKNYGTKLTIVSSDTREGDQFRQLGGIGAILRYNV